MNIKLSENAKLLLVLCISLTVRMVFIPTFGFCFDDAYINYRIAWNIAHGYGMVFNPGEPVQATSTVLYTLLMVPAALVGLGLPLWSKLVNILAMAISIALFCRVLERKLRAGLLWLLIAFLTFNFAIISQDLMGMESSVVILCGILATWLYQQRYKWLLGMVLGLTCLVRPEGLILAFLFWFSIMLFRRHDFWKVSIPIALFIVSWLVFSYLFYGSIIPNTYIAKQAFFSANPSPFGNQLGMMMRYAIVFIPFAPVFVLFLPLGIWRIFVHNKELIPIGCWSIIVLLLQLFSNFRLAPWYLAMVLPLVSIVCVMGVEQLLDRILPVWGRFFKQAASISMMVVLLLGNELLIYFMVRSAIVDAAISDKMEGEIGKWLIMAKIPADKVLAVEAIGRVGYDSNMKIIDIYGLASPEVLPLIRNHELSDQNIVNRFHPDYILSHDSDLTSKVENYALVHVFTSDEKMGGKGVTLASYIYGKEE